ncbi:MAG: glycoside hydrolase family 1 protein [Chloroflexota bacterium]|nr:MAG: glycoside hydrolase family 1 protein [Chloroflexota bacterium]
MVQATYHFPRGFLWGAATASHQVEGNNTNNNWWAWEQGAGNIIQGHKSGLACDWWGGRWKEDFDRAAEAGQNAHRLSIEWSRVQPAPDRWDENAIDYYRDMVRGLRDRNMTVMVTLHHFTDPLWLVDQGGWESETVVEQFEKYVSKVVEALREYVSLWCTINEPNVFATSGYLVGSFPPGKHSLGSTFKVLENMIRAHAAAYRAIHAIQTTARVGIAINYRCFQPSRTWLPLDSWAANMQGRLFNDLFPRALADGVMALPAGYKRIREARGTQDFLGVNYYSRDLVAFDPLKPTEMFGRRFYEKNADLSDTGFIANVPEGMYEALKWGRRFNVPMMVTENGVEDNDDHLRPRYLLQHIHQVWRAVNFNWPVKGYFVWTLVDNFEWERGWTQRFGIWELDVETQARRKRASADLYAEICRENGISTEMVAKYAPEVMENLFPEGKVSSEA